MIGAAMNMTNDELRIVVKQIVNETIGDLDKRIEDVLLKMARQALSMKNLMKVGSFLIICLTIADKVGGWL